MTKNRIQNSFAPLLCFIVLELEGIDKSMFASTLNWKRIAKSMFASTALIRVCLLVFGEVVAAGPHFTLGSFPCHMLVSGHHDDDEEINGFISPTMITRAEIVKCRLTR